MKWFETVKAFRCPSCGERALETVRGGATASGKKHWGVMVCQKCGHKEVFK
jgi:predicted RNA-binding Zn-ribbon protein involved in translation (DUF1610 family)